jgi:DNA-binding response OmpR family regulator
MIEILTVGSAATLGEFSEEIEARDDVSVDRADAGSAALEVLAEKPVAMVVIDDVLPDMTGRDLARKVAARFPLSAVALVSPLAPEDFHEATEGLGVLAQLPVHPGREDARRLLEKLARILRMTQDAGV